MGHMNWLITRQSLGETYKAPGETVRKLLALRQGRNIL